MFKNILDKGKCTLGFHEGEWTYISADQCLQLQICERCATESRRTEHIWGEWLYVTDDACDLVRVCSHCAETESRVDHEWGEWVYVEAHDCTQVQRCDRCAQLSETIREYHDWGAWEYSEAYRAPIRTCSRCYERESSFPRQSVAAAEMESSSDVFYQTEDLVARRQQIMEALWAVEDSAPSLEGPEVRAAAAEAAPQLHQLLDDWELSGETAEALEAGRTWRYLGDAYFSLSGKEDQEALEMARQSYERAGPYLESAGDQLEWAKWAFNLANTLRLIQQDELFPHLEEAKAYYNVALEIFSQQMPEAVPRVESSLASLEQVIQAQTLMQSAKGGLDRLAELETLLQQAGDKADPELLQQVQQEIDLLEAEEPELLAQASSLTGEELLAGDELETEPSITEQGRQRLVEAAGSGADMAALFGMLQEQYQAEIDAGRISPERKQMLGAVMAEGEKMVAAKPDELPDMIVRSAKAKELLMRMSDAVANPDALPELRELPAGSRAAILAELNGRLMKYVISEYSKAYTGEQESETLADLQYRYIGDRNAIARLETDANAYKLEQESLRPLALDTRSFSLRNHLTLARPAWPSPAVNRDPNAVFYSGGPEVMELLEGLCSKQKLSLLPTEAQGDPAQFRWNQLRECNVAIFDLTAYKRPPPTDIAAAVAAVGYELGVALAIGRPVVVMANQGQGLPFDVDVEAVRLAQDGEDERRLSRALDEAMYALQRGGGDSSVDETLSYVRQHMAGEVPTYARIALEQIDESTEADPLKVRDILSAALGYAGPEAPQVLYPTWPGDYPELHGQRCFHVTAFGPDWANETMELVREACRRAVEDIRYIRGDQVLSPDIIRSIWDEICRASHIVVDLTGLNINAVLELGMAHALGRNVLLITQDDRPDLYFRSIAKMRMHHYSLEDPAGLHQVLDAFFETG